MIVIRELAEIFAIHELDSEVLAASIRNPLHMTQAALAGAHIATVPFKVLQQMVHHPLTDKGIVQFKADWEKRARRRPRRPDPRARRFGGAVTAPSTTGLLTLRLRRVYAPCVPTGLDAATRFARAARSAPTLPGLIVSRPALSHR